MDVVSLVVGLLPFVAVGAVAVVAFRRRHDRRHPSPLIVNPYTLAVEPDAHRLQSSAVQPKAPVATGQDVDPTASRDLPR